MKYATSRRAVLAAAGSAFRPAARRGARGASLRPRPPRRGVGGDAVRDAQTDVPSARRPRAQLAFKDSMVHGILQFTPSIAFRYVLHRCESRDIRCRESFLLGRNDTPPPRGLRRTGPPGGRFCSWSLAQSAPGVGWRRPGAPFVLGTGSRVSLL